MCDIFFLLNVCVCYVCMCVCACELFCYDDIHTVLDATSISDNIFLTFSRNSEAFVSEFLEDVEKYIISKTPIVIFIAVYILLLHRFV